MNSYTQFAKQVLTLVEYKYARYTLTGQVVKITSYDTTCREFPIQAKYRSGEIGHFNLRSLEPATEIEYKQSTGSRLTAEFIIQQCQLN